MEADGEFLEATPTVCTTNTVKLFHPPCLFRDRLKKALRLIRDLVYNTVDLRLVLEALDSYRCSTDGTSVTAPEDAVAAAYA